MALDPEIKRTIGQHFVFGFVGYGVNDDIRSLICDYYVGNVILMKRNIQSFEQVHKLVHDLQQLAKDSGHEQPLLIGIDQENGLVSGFSIGSGGVGTQFPGAMCIAATGSTELAEEVTRASGFEMRLVGINWVYSPVADVNTDPGNPVIGPRSFGDDPTRVGEFACAVSRGLTASGIAPSAKHFPGHGDTHVDSHIALPRILKSQDELRQEELVPFRSLIAEDIATIMSGHIALPRITGSDIPCSLSRDITTALLRDDLGFKGVIVTDCLEMDAVAGSYGVENGALMALDAGADIVMVCHTPERQKGAVELVQAAVISGKLTLDSLRQSHHRIAHLKSKFAGSWSDVLAPVFNSGRKIQLKSDNAALSASAYSASTALVTDPTGVLPISGGDAVILFTPENESLNRAVDDIEDAVRAEDGKIRNKAAPSDISFGSSISARTQNMHHTVYAKDFTVTEELSNHLSVAKYIVFATRNTDRSAWQLKALSAIAEVKNTGTGVIIISTCAPYDLLNAKLGFPFAYLATFEFTRPALEAAARVIFGEAKPAGKVPVLDGNIL
ncbi:glycoside hydrolase family 3 protein [Thelephora ganbajun]|uniref:Glycoside hydrolase family 3 protein n=1 Tax=Thelephora ganbajun TaxID=370292 RepID=A0ACB6ZK20_THEGA|nr:glycoside hydrolase family 3 protein [Thelephora ganbajun]